MTGLTVGLSAVACVYLLRRAIEEGIPRIPLVLSIAAGLWVFIAAPQTFAEVLVWSVAALLVWLSDRSVAREEQLFALPLGYLLGAATPYFAFFLWEYLSALPNLAAPLIICFALIAGLVLCGISGAVLSLWSAALSLGLFAQLATAAPVLLCCLGAMAFARTRPRLAYGIAFAAPVLVGLLKGTPA